MPTFPFDHACDPIHSTRSYPSVLCSTMKGSQSPPESYRPRESARTTTYPRRANQRARSRGPLLSYGVMVRIAAKGPSPSGK